MQELIRKFNLAWHGAVFHTNGRQLPKISNRLTSCNGYFLQLPRKGGGHVAVKVHERKDSIFTIDLISETTLIVRNTSSGEEFHGQLVMDSKPHSIISGQMNDVYATSLFGCEFALTKGQCRFCASSPFEGMKFDVNSFRQAMEEVVSRPSGKSCLIINSGSFVDPLATSYELMSSYVQVAKQFGFSKIHIELMPSAGYGEAEIARLAERMWTAGVTSLQVNLEIWDTKNRKRFMPLKSRIDVQTYMRWFHILGKVFPKGKIYSVLLGNLNTSEGLNRAVDALLNVGVVPSIEILRRMTSIWNSIEYLPTPHEELWEKLLFLSQTIATSDVLSLSDIEGCAACGGCNFLMDIIGHTKLKASRSL